MKKFTKLVFAFASIFALVGCGENDTPIESNISHEEAQMRLQKAAQDMSASTGFSLSGKNDLNIELNASASGTEGSDDYSPATNLKVFENSTFALDLLFKDGLPDAAKATASATYGYSVTKDKESENADAEVNLEGYLKEQVLYGKVEGTIKQSDGTTDTIDEKDSITYEEIIKQIQENAGSMTPEQIKATIKAALENLGITIDEEALNTALASLPTPVSNKTKKEETLTWELKNSNIDTVVDTYVEASIPAYDPSLGITEEEYNTKVAEYKAQATFVKTQIHNVLNIKTLVASVTIENENFISHAEVKADITISLPASLGISSSDIVVNLKTNAEASLTALKAGYQISYPEDLASWKQETPDTDTTPNA